VKKKRSGRETYDYVFVWKRKRKKRMRGGKVGGLGLLQYRYRHKMTHPESSKLGIA
jgi:hypothetical protein